jgi:hypothetical protein
VWNAAGGAGYASDVGTRMNANNSQVCVQMGVINLTVARALGRCHFNHCFLASSTTTPLGTVNGMSEVQYGNAFYAERSTFVLEKGTQANLGGAAARFGRMNGTLLPTDQAALQILAGCTLWGATALDISNCPNHGILATEGSRARLTSVAGRGNAKAGFQADNTGGVGIDRDSLTTTITGELGDAEHFHETPPNYVSYATIRTVIVGVKGYPITGDPRASYCTRIDA